ncbi:MAG: hypothetical protein ACE5GD_09195 [Candidatus Geothermarchaeales archaeon]
MREKWGREHFESISEEVEIDERIFRSLFLIPEGFALMDAYVDISSWTMAGVLDTKLYVVKDYFNPRVLKARETLAHELTHMMQTSSFDAPETETFDEKQAWSALIEGDADFTAGVYVKTEIKTSMGHSLNHAVAGAIAPEVGGSRGEDVASVSKLRLFPYNYGEGFVRALFSKGEWNMVNEAYLKPPSTTEQIMHPAKYLDGEGALEVVTPPLNSTGWSLKRVDRMGEHFIFVMLSNWLPEASASVAAGGWGGDSLTYYERDGDWLLLWGVAWDSDVDASEFYNAFLEMLSMVEGEDSRLDGARLWIVDWGYVIITMRDGETLIVGSTDREALLNVHGAEVGFTK